MPDSVTDPLDVLDEVLGLHVDSTKWNDARFERIKRVSNTRVGAVGQDFIERLVSELGIVPEFPVNLKGVRATQSPWDMKLGGIEFELKTATEDVSGNYQFNHIRYHRPYDAVLCVGISPDNVYFGMWTKAEVTTGKAGTLVSMEKGANASYKLTKRPSTLTPIREFAASFDDLQRRWEGK